MKRLLLFVVGLCLAVPALAQDASTPIPTTVSVDSIGPDVAPVVSWTLPSSIPLDTVALRMRIERSETPKGPWVRLDDVSAEEKKTWVGPRVPAADRAALDAAWFRLLAFDTGAPGIAPQQWGTGPPTRAVSAPGAPPSPVADAKLLSGPPASSAHPPGSVKRARSPAGGGATARDVTIIAPANDDGLNLNLSWTAEGAPAAWAVLRAEGDSGDWSVVTTTLPPGKTDFSDKVTTDPRTAPPLDLYTYRIVALRNVVAEDADATAVLAAGTASAAAQGRPAASWFRMQPGSVVLLLLILTVGGLMYWFTERARRGEDIFIRRIPGIDAIEEGIGRATEMGKPVLYVPGIDELQDIQTIASMLILGQVAEKVAEYQSDIIVSCCIPIVREVADEVVRAGFFQAGHPDAYRPQNTRFISSEQFAFCAGTNGIIYREKPATNIYLGRFFAESLILAETGFVNKSIQIAGTAEATQLPFFIAACDYTLIGEELFAVSAYLSKDPRLISSLKASDWIKVACVAAILLGTLEATLMPTSILRTLFTIAGG